MSIRQNPVQEHMERTIPISLYALAQEQEPILIDTCALLHNGNRPRSKTVREKIEEIVYSQKSLDFFLEQIREQGNFFFTPGVIREITKNPDYHGNLTGDNLILEGLISDLNWQAVDFASEIEDRGRILRLNQKETGIFCNLRKVYHRIPKMFKLSLEDSEFLFSGLALARIGRYPIGITNDTRIHQAWENIMAQERNDEEQFRLYVRTGFESFQPLDFSKMPSKPFHELN